MVRCCASCSRVLPLLIVHKKQSGSEDEDGEVSATKLQKVQGARDSVLCISSLVSKIFG